MPIFPDLAVGEGSRAWVAHEPQTRIQRKNVLVVGGSSGIGNAMAQAFLAKGAVVYVWGFSHHRSLPT
jgi:NADPH:quinone reductase-like Zn-dependent oxidoreductase